MPGPDAESDFQPGDEVLGLLAHAPTLEVLLALNDGPRSPAALARETDRSLEEVGAILKDLVNAGCVSMERRGVGDAHDDAPLFRQDFEHIRDLAGSTYARLNFRLGLLGAIERVVRRGWRALRARPETANVAIALATLPDDEETMERALAIVADAEKRVRALAEERPRDEGAPGMRFAILLASQ